MRITALFAAVILTAACDRSARHAGQDDEPWYHASDVALLSTTGRPQLVEFFHPD
ncbi:MAG: hypothetical protein WD801_05620 [Gemmatimonadaceae bacterium]